MNIVKLDQKEVKVVSGGGAILSAVALLGGGAVAYITLGRPVFEAAAENAPPVAQNKAMIYGKYAVRLGAFTIALTAGHWVAQCAGHIIGSGIDAVLGLNKEKR